VQNFVVIRIYLFMW